MPARDFVRKMTLLFDRKITKFYRICCVYCCMTSILSFSWYEPSFLRSHSLVSSRFKCNNKRTIEHSFELNSTNKSIIELIWLKWLGINRRFSFDIDVICGKKSKTLAPISLFSFFLLDSVWNIPFILLFYVYPFCAFNNHLWRLTIDNRRIEWIWMNI